MKAKVNCSDLTPTLPIRNPHTRRAYGRAVTDFFRWCEARRIHTLDQINPTTGITAYLENGGTLEHA